MTQRHVTIAIHTNKCVYQVHIHILGVAKGQLATFLAQKKREFYSDEKHFQCIYFINDFV